MRNPKISSPTSDPSDILRSSSLPLTSRTSKINENHHTSLNQPRKTQFQDAEPQKQLQPKGVDQTDTLSCDSRAPNHRQEIGEADGSDERLLVTDDWWMVGVGGAGGDFNAFPSNAILFNSL